MPILLKVSELRPGMRLYEPVISGSMVMLPHGKPLAEGEIDALRRRFPAMRVSVADPLLDSVIEFEDVSREKEIARTVQTKIAGAMNGVQARFGARADLSQVNFKELQDAVKDIMQFLRDNPTSLALLSRSLDNGSHLGEHIGNVFYLSMLIGAAVRNYIVEQRREQTAAKELSPQVAMDLAPLGLAAMLMDVGMLPLQDLYGKNLPLTDEERKLVFGHPLTSTEMLPESIDPMTRLIVRTHHENSEGTGYPAGLRHEKINVLTRIIRIADAYEAATSDHVYKEAKTPVKALWDMVLGSMRRYYDPVLLKVFVGLIQPFPIGAKLRLNDGRYAVVVKYNRTNAFDPIVVIAFDAQEQPLPKDRLEGPFQLHSRPVRIRSSGGENLAYIYDAPPDEPDGKARLGQVFSTLYQASVP